MESKQEIHEIMDNVALMTLITMCFGYFLFLGHLSGQPEGFYLSHHLSCHLDFIFFSPLYLSSAWQIYQNTVTEESWRLEIIRNAQNVYRGSSYAVLMSFLSSIPVNLEPSWSYLHRKKSELRVKIYLYLHTKGKEEGKMLIIISESKE